MRHPAGGVPAEAYELTETGFRAPTDNLLPESYEPDGNANGRTLKRSVWQALQLVGGDILAMLAWSAMLYFAAVLWYDRGKRAVDLEHHMLNAQMILDATTLVSQP